MKNKSKLIITILIVLLIASFATFVASIVITNPTKLGPGGVTFWFINFLVLISTLTSLALYFIRMGKTDSRKKLLISSVRTGSIIGFSLTLLLALSSLRSLNWRDIILLLLLVILVEVFFRTRRDS